jgi:RNA polymerase sigma-70 factor (ECF subfamily)
MSSDPHPPPTFDGFCWRWRPELCKAALAVLGDEDIAEDVAQRILLRLWTTGRWAEIEAPATYCASAARREALKVLRRRERFEPIGLGEPPPWPDTGAAGPEERLARLEFRERWTQEFLPRLPPRCGVVMTLLCVEGLKPPEVADRLGMSSKAVGKQVTRGRELLRGVLDVSDDGDLIWVSSEEDGGV